MLKLYPGVAMEVQDSLFSTALEGVLATTNDVEAFTGAQVMVETYVCNV